MTERYIIDDAGTLIDIETRNTYDYVNEVCELLNELATKCSQLKKENEQLKQFKEQVFNIINKKLQDNERLDGVDTAMYYANRQTLNELKKELEE